MLINKSYIYERKVGLRILMAARCSRTAFYNSEVKMSVLELLNNLYDTYKEVFKGKEIVVGSGNTSTRLLLIGEAPGKDEVRLGKPFVGAAGKNLSEFLNIVGINREDIYITNAIKYRLSRLNQKTGRYVNRPAARQEIEANRTFLIDEISIIKPRYIATLGSVPLKSLLCNYGLCMGDYHGKLLEICISSTIFKLYPLYHPASIIYNQSLKDVYIEDIKKLSRIMRDNI
jgi:DNA polymerase